MKNLFFLLLFFSFSFSQSPGWLIRLPSSSSASLPSSSSERPKVVYRTKVETKVDTVFRVDTVHAVRIDTIRDTVSVFPSQYKYVIRYALAAINIEVAPKSDLGSGFDWSDYASHAQIIARDTATLRIGSEDIRTLGHIIDQFGNRIPQQEVITTGFTVNVLGNRAVIEYRGKNSVALFSGSFDSSGYLIAEAEIEESGLLAKIFPFNLFFGVNRKKVIIEIVREVL